MKSRSARELRPPRQQQQRLSARDSRPAAAARLERALRAASSPTDEAASPEPKIAPTRRGRRDAPPPSANDAAGPSADFSARHRALAARAERLQQGSLETRTLLREVEGLLRNAHKEAAAASDDEDAAAAASSAPSRHLAADWGGGGGGGARRPPPRARPASAEQGDVEAVRARRLRECDRLHSALAPVQRGLARWGDELSSAAAGTARLEQALSEVLAFSDADVRSELLQQEGEDGGDVVR